MTPSKALIGLLTFVGITTSLQAQDYALSTNIPSLLLGNINIEPSIPLSSRLTLQLGLSARPKSFGLPMPVGMIHWLYNQRSSDFSGRMNWGTVKHAEHVTFSPGIRLWSKGNYNRGVFFGLNALAMLYRYGSDKQDKNYSEGFLLGGGISAGYSYELAPHWNIEAEAGVAGAWTKYDLHAENGTLVQADKSRLLVLPSRLAVRLVYLF